MTDKKTYRVLVEFPTKADAPDHAVEMIRAFIRGKGITNEGPVPVEHYVFIRPETWE